MQLTDVFCMLYVVDDTLVHYMLCHFIVTQFSASALSRWTYQKLAQALLYPSWRWHIFWIQG